MDEMKKCCCSADEDALIEEGVVDEKACCKKDKSCKCCVCCKLCKALLLIGVGFLVGVHFRAIKALIKGQPMPKAPAWHCWVKKK